ncbi:HEAT repeat domain-containing protein [Embleya scabrispora]|uniref:HEAT repeat domain-containing protein n=1 Tax=Embleya scabrispora TaxID=159449 RepID=UPI0024806865|nr:HEAT repeat domain-containing protein [Embleya scabrispora]
MGGARAGSSRGLGAHRGAGRCHGSTGLRSASRAHSPSRCQGPTWAVGGLGSAIETASPEALVAATEGIGDPNAAVRRAACRALASAPPDTADVSDLLAARLVDPDQDVRVEAAARLALRDDPRSDETLHGLDPTDEDSPYHWLLDDVCRHRASRR